MNEINITLNEVSFTNVCKIGFIRHTSNENGTTEIYLNKEDIRKIMWGEYISKKVGFIYNIRVININNDTIRELVKRSPIFSDLVI